jgi:hypothetical protein
MPAVILLGRILLLMGVTAVDKWGWEPSCAGREWRVTLSPRRHYLNAFCAHIETPYDNSVSRSVYETLRDLVCLQVFKKATDTNCSFISSIGEQGFPEFCKLAQGYPLLPRPTFGAIQHVESL